MTSDSQQNPFRSPETSVEAIVLAPLTRTQRRSLTYLMEHRGQRLYWGKTLWKWARKSFAGLLTYGALIWVGYLFLPKVFPGDDSLPHYIAVGVIAFLMGSMLQDIVYMNHSIETWPVIQDVIDWDKVTARLEE